MQRPESQLKNIETLSLAFAKLKSNLYVQWFLLFSIILLAIVPKTMINGHYIYPDLYFKYPAWFDFINKMPKFSPLSYAPSKTCQPNTIKVMGASEDPINQCNLYY